MPLVDLICLANSFKLGGRCIAGLRADGKGWVRPIAPDTTHGQLYSRHLRLDDNTEPQVLDVITMDLAQAKPIPGQPENWEFRRTPWVLWERPAGIELESILRAALDRGPELLGSTSRSIAEVDARSAAAS